MKTIKQISALLLIGMISISNLFAAGFPDEPMIIYGNVSDSYSGILEIHNEENILIKTVSVENGKYGTDKTFDENKIMIPKFSGNLIFTIKDREVINILESSSYPCNENPIFQDGEICQYDLVLKDDSSQEFEDIFNGKTFEEKRNELKSRLGENIIRQIASGESIKVLSKNLPISNKVNKNTILLDFTQKEALYLPKDVILSESNVTIEVPRKISDTTTIGNKINKRVVGAIEIPTNKQVTFDKPIRVCTNTTHNNITGLSIFYSHDNTNWTLDTSVNQLEISNEQVCFNVNHLTSFAVGYEVPSTNKGGGSSSKKRDNCPNGDYTKSRYDKECGEKESFSEISETSSGSDTSTLISSMHSDEIEKKDNIDTKSDNIESLFSEFFSEADTSKLKQVEKNEEGEITIDSKSYIRNLKRFNFNKRKIINDSGYEVIHIESDNPYNKKIEKYTAKIFQDIKHPSIRDSMFKHMNRMSTTYGIYYDTELETDLKSTYKEKLRKDITEFQFKLKKLKIKDMIVQNTLEKRRLRELEAQKND